MAVSGSRSCPHLDLVLVVTAGNYNQPDAWQVPVTIIREILIPALQAREGVSP